jgi:hypothetical protein
VNKLSHRLVELMPEILEEGVLYASLAYGTASHRCCCGCGREVVTPLTPTDWKLIFDGETVSLYPSIGSWNFPCRSHYWIRNNRVEWAEQWSDWQIAAAEDKDQKLKERFYRDREEEGFCEGAYENTKNRNGFWSRLWTGW